MSTPFIIFLCLLVSLGITAFVCRAIVHLVNNFVLYEEVSELNKKLNSAEFDAGLLYTRCRRLERENRDLAYQLRNPPARRIPAAQVGLPEGLAAKDLIMLCHPDRHGNSELANRVTAELLKLRKNVPKR